MISLIFAAMLGCTTRISGISTSATDQVTIIRGNKPVIGAPLNQHIVAQGIGYAEGKTSYVITRRFWLIAQNENGMTVLQYSNEPKGGPLAACTFGVLFLGIIPSIGCLYVSGPTSDTLTILSPTEPSSNIWK